MSTNDALRERCAEILQWQKTGVLTGNVLREYAQAKYGDDHNALQCAEADTAREAFTALAASKPEPQAQAGQTTWEELDAPVPVPELQVQAEEPKVVAVFRSDSDCGHVDLVPYSGEISLQDGDELIMLRAHREAMGRQRKSYTKAFRAELKAFRQEWANGVAKKDAALKACVAALEKSKSFINDVHIGEWYGPLARQPDVVKTLDAAITQANKALK